MTAIVVPMTKENMKQLRQLAQSTGVSAEELAKTGLEDWLLRSRQDSRQTRRLEKNADLLKRIA